MIKLRLIKNEDIAEINNWPEYVDEFAQMNYAVREHGWIKEFRDKPNCWVYIANLDKQIIGFSLLSITSEKEAEFRIAIHPDMIGKGYGNDIALETLGIGFHEFNLDKIYLIVRKNNPRAAKLYEKIGFEFIGESIHEIQEMPVDFYDMVMTKDKYDEVSKKMGKRSEK